MTCKRLEHFFLQRGGIFSYSYWLTITNTSILIYWYTFIVYLTKNSNKKDLDLGILLFAVFVVSSILISCTLTPKKEIKIKGILVHNRQIQFFFILSINLVSNVSESDSHYTSKHKINMSFLLQILDISVHQ